MKSFKLNEECYVQIGGEKRRGYISNVHPNNTYDVKPFGRYAAIEKLKPTQIIKFKEKKIPAPHKTSFEKVIEQKKMEEPTQELIDFAEIISAKKDSLVKCAIGVIIGSSNNNYKLKIVGMKEASESSCRTLRVGKVSKEMQVFSGWLKSKTITADFLYYLVIWGGFMSDEKVDEGSFTEAIFKVDVKSINHYLTTGRDLSNLVDGYKYLLAGQTNIHTKRVRFEGVKSAILQKHPALLDLSKETLWIPEDSIAFRVGEPVIYQFKKGSIKQSKIIHHCNDDGTYDLREDNDKIESKILENIPVSKISLPQLKENKPKRKFVVDEIVLWKIKSNLAKQARVVEVNADNTYELKVEGAGGKLIHNVFTSKIVPCAKPIDFGKVQKENLIKLK